MCVHGVLRYVVLFMKNNILSTTLWCKVPVHFDGFGNEDCWFTCMLKLNEPQTIVQHNTFLVIRVNCDHIYAQIKIFDVLKLLSKPRAPKGILSRSHIWMSLCRHYVVLCFSKYVAPYCYSTFCSYWKSLSNNHYFDTGIFHGWFDCICFST